MTFTGAEGYPHITAADRNLSPGQRRAVFNTVIEPGSVLGDFAGLGEVGMTIRTELAAEQNARNRIVGRLVQLEVIAERRGYLEW